MGSINIEHMDISPPVRTGQAKSFYSLFPPCPAPLGSMAYSTGADIVACLLVGFLQLCGQTGHPELNSVL